jgi:LEA14-like dessication related protein
MKQIVSITLKLFVMLVMMLSLSGCDIISRDSFVFHGAKVLNFSLSEGATVEMTIENKSMFKVTIVGGELTANCDGEPIGSVYIKNPVKLPRKSTTTVTLNLGLRFDSPIAALKAVKSLISSPDKVTVSGYGEGKVWFFRKRFERKDVPLSKFIAIFGDVSNYIKM